MSKSTKTRPKRPWQDIAKEAQDHRDATIDRVQPPIPLIPANLPRRVVSLPRELLSDNEVQITNTSPEDLIHKLATGELTATAVTKSFLRSAGVAQKLSNCVTELLTERALARAKYLDDYFTQHRKPIGPFHGLPISVKEHIGMKGLHLSSGYVAQWDKISEGDAHILKILWQAGAIFHARTTQPQTMMHLETDSNLYGITVSPYNQNLSAGGSSGGEGALIALRGSCLGIGSDVGGSIRSPAANNGLYGLKPTGFRLPTDGWSSILAGADSVVTVVGPLCTSLEGIKIFMKTIIEAKPWLSEPAIVPLPWNTSFQISPHKHLKIAVMWHDNVVQPHPPIIRALRSVVSRLKQIPNVSVIDWEPYQHDEAWAIISSLYFTDSGAEDISAMAASGEPLLPLTKWIIKENPCVKKLTMQKLQYWQEEREAYRNEYARVWNDTATGRNSDTGALEGMVDVILCPVGPGVAPKLNTAKYWSYTSQWNLLDYPALVFPVDKVSAELDRVDEDHEPLNGLDQENWELYDPETFDGLPISLQLVGRRFEDEKVIAVLEYIKAKIGLPFEKFP